MLKKIKFRHLKTKLVLVYAVIFFLVTTMSVSIIYMNMKASILKSVDETLTMQIGLIRNSIESSVEASIKNYFRSSAYSCRDLTQHFYNLYKSGEMSEEEAKKSVFSILSSYQFGESGYIAIINTKREIVYHPHAGLIGSDVSEHEFTKSVIESAESFVEYRWQNPGEVDEREKALYNIHFKPWDWHISVTGYKDEFLSLVNIEDFEDKILSIRFGDTGYPIVLDLEGTLLIHPEYKGVNMYNRQDSMGEVTRKAISEREGRAEYMWKNPGESEYRKKVTIYSEIPSFHMVVAATAYESEFLKPLEHLKYVFILTLLGSLVVLWILTIQVSHSITTPIIKIKAAMDRASDGNLSVRTDVDSIDEVGSIAQHFNGFLEVLEENQRELKNEVVKNAAISDELRASIENLQYTQRKLIEEERFSNMGKLVVRVSHHLNTPIGNARMASSFIEQTIDELSSNIEGKNESPKRLIKSIKNLEESTGILDRALNNAIGIIDSFNKLNIDNHTGTNTEINMHNFLTVNYMKNWRPRIPENIELNIDCETDVELVTSVNVLNLVLDHLTENSIRHGFSKDIQGMISISVKRKENSVKIIYEDNGIGVPLERSNYIFEPFFSAHGQMNSAGLGLSIIYNSVVGSLSGSIIYEKNEPSGVRFIITLPDLID